ncbi:peptidoglycan-binding protein [Saccharothrix longispora]|uniref:peptidoglycan-binding domain-containing protein n=1 Tax=Saccharothrix longispora TaxID=33920 RepID=UPI0028FD2081|nr:peptidoglycan-binding protein [Saccharothrix longispora]MBY8849690.1 peptidoglycan-binding protein [Saccharothrix sp. MB29]MDU0287667.1 peptidoglycan-binding protein [Saccharothrix longispora]
MGPVKLGSLRVAVLAMALAAGLSAGFATPAGARVERVALPSVDMEAVLKAAQIDPRRADSAITPGAGSSVLLVERALVAEGLLASSYADGHFGTKTIDAYAAYQRSLGYTGIDASGFPGPTSLRLLGETTYAVTRPVSAGSRVTFRGATVNTRTKAMVVEAERLLGRTLGITQGSYNPGGVAGSAGTHDGGGALDISVSGMTAATRTAVAKALRRVGFAAWVRTPAQGDWGYHVHAIAINDPDLSSGAQHQAGDYYLGLNGLANRGADDGPPVAKVTWEEYQRAR